MPWALLQCWGGLHGISCKSCVLLCLAPLLTVQVWRAGRQYKQSFSRGVPQGPLEESAAEVDAAARGTQVWLKVWGLRTGNHFLS